MYRDVILQITLFEVCPDLYKSPVYICIHLLYLLDAGLLDTF